MPNSQDIAIRLILKSADNPRQTFDAEELRALTRSIKTSGVLQPLIVRPHPRRKNHFELIAGERRLRAAEQAKLLTVPCVVRDDLSAQEVDEIRLVENMQRAGVPALEEAAAIEKMRQTYDLDVQEIAARLGVSEVTVYGRLSLLRLPEAARQAIKDNRLAPSAALEIARLKPDQQEAFCLDLFAAAGSRAVISISQVKQHINRFNPDKAARQNRVRGEARGKTRSADSSAPGQEKYAANWKQYLVNFTPQQFVAWQKVVRGRTETNILSEAVESVMLEARAIVAEKGAAIR